MFGRARAKVANVAQFLDFLAAGAGLRSQPRPGRSGYDPTQQHSTAPSETNGSLH